MSDASARSASSWAGVAAGPVGLIIGQEPGYLAATVINCAQAPLVTLLAHLVGLAVVAAGGWLSWRSWRQSRDGEARAVRREHFVAGLSVWLAALFALAILTQAMAGFVFQGCER